MEKKQQTEMIFIRHGETTHNAQRRFQGHLDTALSKKGHRQATALAQRLTGTQFAALYSSDLTRTMQTARPIAECTGLAIQTDSRIRERDVGVFSGMTVQEIEQNFPAEYERFLQRDPEHVIPQGESTVQMATRVLAAFADIPAKHTRQRLLVVTHGGPITALLHHTLHIPFTNARRYSNHNASLNIFTYRNGIWKLMTWGDIAHLSGQPPAALEI